MTSTPLTFSIPTGTDLSATLQRPEAARALFVMGHGSGSNMNVPLMTGLADALYERDIATLRYNYPYSEHIDFVPFTNMPVDPEAIFLETIAAALKLAQTQAPDLPIFVGGHSISGLAASLFAAQQDLDAKGIIALAFPRKGDAARSAHMQDLALSTLIVQGTKDTLGTEAEISEMAAPLAPIVQLKWLSGASHVLTSEEENQSAVIANAADHIRNFIKPA